MKKKLVIVLVVIALVLALAVAGILGFIWYRDNHVFVEGKAYPLASTSLDLREEDISFAHYNELQGKLPRCKILWNVPFQSGTYSSDIQSITIRTLTEAEIQVLKNYFPDLKTVDAMECDDYAVLERLKAEMPALKVEYEVFLGQVSVTPEALEMVLEVGEYTFEALMENFVHLPKLQSVKLRMPEIPMEQVEQLRQAYPEITITCTVEILGQEYDTETTELDLSALKSENVAAVKEKLSQLPKLAAVKLTDQQGVSQLTAEDVLTLKEAAPEAIFDYSFDFYGTTISTADEEVHIKNVKIGDEGETQVRQALDLMQNCKRFVLENCQISNDVLAKIRDDYREKTKVVWRVSFGRGSTMTDAEIIRAVYHLSDANCKNLIYCEDARFLDFGHNGDDDNYLHDCSYVAGMPNLEACILSSAYISDLSAFSNCKKLKFLEIAFCGLVTDISPLAECKELQMLNISYTGVTDISALDELPITLLCAKNYSAKRVSQEDQEHFKELHPDCWAEYEGEQPYGAGWRYAEDGEYLPYYAILRSAFRYDLDPNIPNHVGWYLADETKTMIAQWEESTGQTEPAEETQAEESTDETQPEETQAETLAETTETE